MLILIIQSRLMEAEEIFLMFTRAREKLVLLYGPRTKDITLDIYTIKNKEEIKMQITLTTRGINCILTGMQWQIIEPLLLKNKINHSVDMDPKKLRKWHDRELLKPPNFYTMDREHQQHFFNNIYEPVRAFWSEFFNLDMVEISDSRSFSFLSIHE